ncbi:hypothetical protein [Rhodanobacter sp. T12-5]|uniref:hypothetical protein n=1 Tax=Rhodanobacter sp. T12-5 TaxID=2024611 RepID=UPI0011EBA3B0|nr:hypothetical protein [Rhodanobacter sp. T12-5]KAA0071650.1 hypothetical protein CIW53_00045 [Rhodanobacter sp. T12-5]
MQPDPDQQIDWRAAGHRIVVHVVVIGIHLGMALMLLGAPISLWHAAHGKTTRARKILQLRFVSAVARKPPAAVAAAIPFAVHTRRQSRTPRTRQVVDPASALAPPAPPANTATPVEGSGYIPGGNLLMGASQLPRSAVRLPGSAVAIVPGLHMTDPRMQGVAGAVRTLQALLGVPDPHCVDVDAWRTLSKQELLDRHVSPEQVENTAAEYHCFSHHT